MNAEAVLSSENGIGDRQVGFTLLDVLIVILILGILAVIGFPRFQSLAAESKLTAAAGELVSGLEYAAALSVEHNRPFGVTAVAPDNRFFVFDTDPYPTAGATVRLDNVPPVNADDVVVNPFDKGWYVIDFDDVDAFRGVNLTDVPSGGEIRFYPDGHCAASDPVYTLGYAGLQLTVTVDGMSGRVTVE